MLSFLLKKPGIYLNFISPYSQKEQCARNLLYVNNAELYFASKDCQVAQWIDVVQPQGKQMEIPAN